VVANPDKDRLVFDLLDLTAEDFDREPIERQPLPGARQRTRAFLKVQDGCDNHCTFCITTIARGDGRSRAIADVLADVCAAQRGGAQEVALTGVHLGSWGADFAAPQPLKTLVQAILDRTDIPRLRLSSLEPWDLDEDFFSLWQNPRLCRHLHLPLQSGSAAALRRMARKTTPEGYAALLAAARAAIPGVAITTDIIAGFPGEDEAEFADSLAFVRQMDFAGGHVFTYSERPGTAAARMPGCVPYPVRKARNAQMRRVFAEAATAYRQQHVGHELAVLWESAAPLDSGNWELSGLTDNYLRVRTHVVAHSPENLWNQITPVRLVRLGRDGLTGEIIAC
jgi:threonylcarbamoyladenosine tRNA methylthiotransferase MtaB